MLFQAHGVAVASNWRVRVTSTENLLSTTRLDLNAQSKQNNFEGLTNN